MMTMTTARTEAGAIPKLTHEEGMGLAQTEFGRIVDLLRQLRPEEWQQPTVCALWDVRAMAGHVLGMAQAQASLPQFLHDFRSARKLGGSVVDGINATQVKGAFPADQRAGRRRLASSAPRAVKGRRRTPAPMRSLVRMRQDPPFQAERWQYGYLVDRIFTRDTWVHRLDIARATGREMVLTPDHDGRIVADVVAEWAQRHGRPFDLTLTGLAGGRWGQGTGGESIEIDALDFCWTLSGRMPGRGLLAIPTPF